MYAISLKLHVKDTTEVLIIDVMNTVIRESNENRRKLSKYSFTFSIFSLVWLHIFFSITSLKL